MQPQESLQGILSIITTVIYLIISIKIISKYKDHKDVNYILLGIAVFGLALPITGQGVGFIWVISTGIEPASPYIVLTIWIFTSLSLILFIYILSGWSNKEL